MFEKEAEDRIRKLEERQTLGVYDNDEDLARDEGFNDGELYGYEEGFHDGAEFGYNKCKEEINKNGLALQLDMDKTIEQNFALKAQIEKLTDTETMLKILKDRGVIRSWYYNGTYHVGNELSKQGVTNA